MGKKGGEKTLLGWTYKFELWSASSRVWTASDVFGLGGLQHHITLMRGYRSHTHAVSFLHALPLEDRSVRPPVASKISNITMYGLRHVAKIILN